LWRGGEGSLSANEGATGSSGWRERAIVHAWRWEKRNYSGKGADGVLKERSYYAFLVGRGERTENKGILLSRGKPRLRPAPGSIIRGGEVTPRRGDSGIL